MIDKTNPDSKELRKLWDGEAKRRDRSERTTHIYDEEWTHHLQKEISRRFTTKEVEESLNLVAETTLNPLRWLAEKTGAIYSKSPRRYIDGVEVPSDSPVLADGRFNAMMDEACQLVQAHRDGFLRFIVDDDEKIDVDIILPSQAVIQTGNSPSKIEWILYECFNGQDIEYQFWSSSTHGTMNKDFVWIPTMNKDGEVVDSPAPNPYGVIPIVPVHARFPARRFWQANQSNGIVRTTLEAGVAMTEFRYLQKMQSFKILHTTVRLDKDFVLDPANPLQTPGGTANVLDWQADLTSFLETIMTHISTVLNFMGIRPDSVRGTLDASSGYALTIKMHDLEVVWDKLRQIWTMWEKQIWQVVRKIYEYHTGKTVHTDGELTIEYADIGPADDPKERAELARVYKDIGMSERHVWEELGYDEEWIDENFAQKDEEMLRAKELDIPEDEDGDDAFSTIG